MALASILSLDPDILIFDEVMSQLDLDNVKRVQKIISTLKKIGKSIIIIDHELSRLKQVDELYLMEKGNLDILIQGKWKITIKRFWRT